MEYPKGDVLSLVDGSAYLPVHRSWILAIGVIGRFNTGLNDAARGREPAVFHLTPRARRTSSHSEYITIQPHEVEGRSATRAERNGTFSELYGTTGSIEMLKAQSRQASSAQFQASEYIIFKLRPILQLQHLKATTISMEDLVLFSIGFLKFQKNQYISLTWVSKRFEDLDSNDDNTPPSPQPPVGTYIPMTQLPRETAPRMILDAPAYRAPVAYAMRTVELDRSVRDMILPFTNLDGSEFQSLEPLNDSVTRRAIENFYGSTWVPADEPWVRIDTGSAWEYISRPDAQKLAFSILNLTWHPDSYLLGGNRDSAYVHLLTSPAKRLWPMLARLQSGMRYLSLGDQDRQKCLSVLGPVSSRLEKESIPPPPKKSLLEALYNLDLVLDELGGDTQEGKTVSFVAGILMITNLNFQDLLHDSIRNLREITQSNIQLNLRSTTLKVPSSFGIMQHFPVDMDQILPDEPRRHETIAVTHTAVILAALRGAVRCAMVLTCYDADPLLSLVGDFEDVVYMK